MMTSADQKNTGTGEIMLFGVRLVVDSMRKCVSLNNLSEYEQPLDSSNSNTVDVAGGYASADEAAVAARSSAVNRERKRGVPWTEDEHKLFLVGLEKIGKGDWRGISRNFVKTRTPTQVASHAQKYFLRRSNLNRRRRRSSLFDITGDSGANPINDRKIGINGVSFEIGSQTPPPPPPPLLPASVEANSEISAFRFSVPETSRIPAMTTMMLDQTLPIFSASVHPINESTAGFDLSLTLSLSMSSDHQTKSSSSMNSAFQVMQGFNNGDSIISVA